MMTAIGVRAPTRDEENGWKWNQGEEEKYVVKEMYLQPHARNISNEEESSCQLWKLKVPSNIKGFVWKLSYIVCKQS